MTSMLHLETSPVALDSVGMRTGGNGCMRSTGPQGVGLDRERGKHRAFELLAPRPSVCASGDGNPLSALSAREREAFFLMICGFTIREICAAMSIRPKTAENYRFKVLYKLDAKNAVEAVHYAVRHGLLVP